MKHFIVIFITLLIGILMGIGLGYSLFYAEFGQFVPYIEMIKSNPLAKKQIEEQIQKSIDKTVEKSSSVDIDLAESTPVRFGAWEKQEFEFNKTQYFKIKLINETENAQEISIKIVTDEDITIEPESWQKISVRRTSYEESGMEIELTEKFSRRQYLKNNSYFNEHEFLKAEAQLVWKENVVSRINIKIFP